MKAIAVGLLSHLKACFFTSWRTTVVGLAVGVGGETLNYLGTVPNLPPWAHGLLGVATAAFVFYRGNAPVQVAVAK